MGNIRRKRSIEILGEKHKVRHINTGDSGGFYEAATKTIEIDKTVNDQDSYNYTLFHEGAHGVIQITGLHQDLTLVQEHVIIDSLWSFLKNNFTITLK